jgi:hypothetical protein
VRAAGKRPAPCRGGTRTDWLHVALLDRLSFEAVSSHSGERPSPSSTMPSRGVANGRALSGGRQGQGSNRIGLAIRFCWTNFGFAEGFHGANPPCRRRRPDRRCRSSCRCACANASRTSPAGPVSFTDRTEGRGELSHPRPGSTHSRLMEECGARPTNGDLCSSINEDSNSVGWSQAASIGSARMSSSPSSPPCRRRCSPCGRGSQSYATREEIRPRSVLSVSVAAAARTSGVAIGALCRRRFGVGLNFEWTRHEKHDSTRARDLGNALTLRLRCLGASSVYRIYGVYRAKKYLGKLVLCQPTVEIEYTFGYCRLWKMVATATSLKTTTLTE